LNDTAHTNDDPTQRPRRRSLPARLTRVAVWSGLTCVVLIFAVAGFTETSWFKGLLRDIIVENADANLNARLSIGKIDGNLLSGWAIDDVRLWDEHGDIATIGRIVLRYDLMTLFWKRITIKELTLDEPHFFITRGEGRDWNINTLFRPREVDEDTVTTPFDWRVVVNSFRIVQGRLLVYDSTVTGEIPAHRLDDDRMDLRDITLALRADYRQDLIQLSLNQCSFTNAFGDVSVSNVSGDIILGDNGAELRGLSVQTSRSALLLTAAVDSVNILDGIDEQGLPDYPMALSLRAPVFDIRDLLYFLPALDFLDGSVALDLRAKGSLRDLNVEKLLLEAYDTRLHFSGTLRDILEGTGMRMDIQGTDVRIAGADVPVLLPGIPIMDLTDIGVAEFAVLKYQGSPLAFTGEIDVSTAAGAVAGSVSFDFTGEDILYDGTVRTRGLDLSRILRDPAMSSSINGEASIRGQGTSIGSMQAVLNARMDSSRYQRLPFRRLTADVVVHADSLDMALDFQSSAGALTVSGAMGFSADSITGFRVASHARSLDLEPLLNDAEYNSDLTFSMTARGDGVTLDAMSAEIEIAVEESRLGQLVIERDTLRVALRQNGTDDELLLIETQYADARFDGRFDIPRFFEYLAVQADSLSAAFAALSVFPDSSGVEPTDDGRRGGGDRAISASQRSTRQALAIAHDTAAFMDLRYAITLKQPERIARYFNASTFIVRGTYNGSITGGYNGFDVTGEARISDFYLVDSSRTWLAAGVRLSYELSDLRLDRPLEQLSFRALFAAADANIDGLHLHRIEASLAMAGGAPRLRLRGKLDTLFDVDIEGQGRFLDRAVEIDFPIFRIGWLEEQIVNDGPARLRIDSAGIAVERFELTDGGMRLSVAGLRSFDGDNNFSLYVDSLDVPLLEYGLTGSRAAQQGEGFTGIVSVEANLTGSDDAPLIAAAVYIDSLGYRGSIFGILNMEARYFEQNLEVYSELDYRKPDGGTEKIFFLSGVIPVSITFAEEDAEQSRGSANLRMQMRDFPLVLLEEFLGLFSPLSGRVNGDIAITGTADAPSFDGYIAVEDGGGRFVFNNMDYRLSLRIEADKQDIRIVNAAIENLPADWSDGRITAEGRISTEAFAISTFELALRGKLKVLKPASRAVMRSLYGDLFISTGNRDLTWRGRLDRSLLFGDIVVEQGALVFPYEQRGGPVADYADFTYVLVDDTTRQFTSSLSAGRFSARAALQAVNNNNGAVVQPPERSILDGLSYDMTIGTSGRLRVEIPITMMQAELFASLMFDNLKISNFGGREGSFVGEVRLGQDSDVIFLGKRMSASGTLRFTRDPQNPDLDLVAVYSDYYTDPATDIRRQIFVKVFITGSKEQPELRYDMRWDDPEGGLVSQGGDIASDAFSFVVFGVFAKDLTQTGNARSAAIDMAPDLAMKMGSALASTAATQFLATAGLQEVINRLDFADLGTQDQRVKFTSSIGRALITYDGKISDLGSSNVTVEFPLSRILGIPWVNFVVQIARRTVDITTESAAQTQEFSIYEFKLFQRFSF
jgi:hypothetical protein